MLKQILLSCVALMALLGGCQSEDEATPQEGVNVIAIMPLKGDFGTKGDLHLAAIQMAIEDLHSAGLSAQINGKAINLKLVPTADTVAATTDLLTAAVTELGGPAKIAAVLSSTNVAHEASLHYAIYNQISHFEVSSGSPDHEFHDHSDDDDFLKFAMSSREVCPQLAEMAADLIFANNYQRVALLRGTQTHDKMHIEVIRARLQTLGWTGTFVDAPSEYRTDPESQADGTFVVNAYDKAGDKYQLFQEAVEAINAQGGADAIFYHLRGDSVNLKFLQDSLLESRAQFTGDIVTCGMSYSSTLLTQDVTPKFVDGGLIFAMRGPPESPALDAFKTDYAAFTDNRATHDTFNASAYDAMILVGLGLAASKGELGVPLRDAIINSSREGSVVEYKKLSDAFSLLSAGTDINYNGPSGLLDMRDDRSVPGSYWIEGVQPDGQGGYAFYEFDNPARTQK